MPKRSASDALAAVVPAPKQVDSGIRSRSGRTVKPRVWDDGTLAAPLAALKDEAGEQSPGAGKRPFADRADAADPDFTPQEAEGGEEGRGHGGHAHAPAHKHNQGSGGSEEEEEGAYSSESPRVSVDGSQGGGSTGRARSGSVGRDEHGKFTSGPRPRGSRGRRGEGGGGIFKQAAVEVLRLEKRLMSTGEIARVALKRGLIKCTGKTPEATMASALYTDIKRKEGQSVFIRPHEGLFGLREWVEQGVAFQDEFAEEMAKRAAAAYGAYVGMPGMPMLPPMMDSDGMPIATPFPMMPFPGMAPMPGMPMLAPMLPGMPHPLAMPPHAVSAGAAKAGGADGGDGLMELLEAAEELHKSAEKGDGQEAREGRQPAGEGAAAAAEAQQAQQAAGEAAAPMEAEQQAAGTPDAARQQADQAAEQQRQQPGGGDAAPAAAGAAAGSEEGDAAAALAAVAAEAAGGAKVTPPSAGQAGSVARQQGGYPEGAMPYPMQYPAPYGYPPYFYPHPAFMYPPHAPSLPPLPKAGAARGGTGDAGHAAAGHAAPDLLPAGSTAGLDLTVRGTNRPFAGARGGSLAAAVEAAGQEQVNILNLPLPEAADMAQAPGGGRSSILAPPAHGAPDPQQLKEAEASVMRLEKDLGTSHPEVGKAYLSLSRLYLAGCGDSAAKQLATAALSRSWEILNVCQVHPFGRLVSCCSSANRFTGARRDGLRQLALKKQPSCTSSFSYLMDKIRTAEAAPVAAALAPPPPPAGAAPPASVGVPPAAMPAAAAALSLASPPPAAAGQRHPGGAVTAH